MKKKEVDVIPGQGMILVTADKETTTKSGLIIAGGKGFEYKELQRVVAIGQDVPAYIMIDDIVKINIGNYKQLKYNEKSVKADINGNYVTEYVFPLEEIDGREFMLLRGFSDIKYLIPVNDAHFTREELTERRGIITGMGIV